MVYRTSCTQITGSKIFIVLLCLLSPVLLTHCACPPADLADSEILYQASQPDSVKALHTPAFLIKEPDKDYNRIGLPSVRKTADKQTEIYVDPAKPAVFFESQEFSTTRGRYQNLIYRIHFSKVPLSFSKIHITAGNNPGLLIIYTLDTGGQLLLITTVHTCGCFLAFLPTSELPIEWFPSDWPADSQWIYGHYLPSLLDLSQTRDSEKIVFTLESETHRVCDVAISGHDPLHHLYDTIDVKTFSMNALYHLPISDEYRSTTESFFEMDGPRKGYVRNNTKILERLFISWWAFDLYVGEDKAFGSADTSETPFYTSLKFWDREESDLKNFPRFLSYWGWKL